MFREATEDDLWVLAELERDANLAALSHVFPPDRYPFPFDAVLARWRLVLDDPGAVVLVLDAGSRGALACYAAYDEGTLRHLAVRPDRWGEGLATAAVHAVASAASRAGATTMSLWVLEDNHRARRLYSRLGWRQSAESRAAPWPPHPVELRYEVDLLDESH